MVGLHGLEHVEVELQPLLGRVTALRRGPAIGSAALNPFLDHAITINPSPRQFAESHDNVRRADGTFRGGGPLQGVGAAVLAPSALSLLTRSFAEGKARNRAMAAYRAVAGLGAAFGLVVGGLVADLISWRAGFFLNVPIGLVMTAPAVRFLPETERRGGRFDVAGALLATLGSTALVLSIIDAADHGLTASAT
ncbi:MFS transporter [Streptomyces sp. NPDC040750]|uniref:MFS transporter n=1 Tax=Streptomyces sp. NPDC040750 TaxID=3154491 RepID=UPI0033C950C2